MTNIPILTSDQMRLAEKEAFEKGSFDYEFMDEVARNIASYLLRIPNLIKVIVITGKGNKGGDGALIARLLLRKKIDVEIFYLHDPKDCSPLLKEHLEAFIKDGGPAIFLKQLSDLQVSQSAIILDAILGSGFKGRVEGFLKEVIERVNQLPNEVFAIDIPSGLDGNTGLVSTTAIKAKHTFLKSPKWGFFVGNGFEFVGELIPIEFSLPENFFNDFEIMAYLLTKATLKSLLPPIKRTRHKYQAGIVCGLCNQFQMSGASELASLAALKSGAGYMRFLYPKELENKMVNVAKEVVKLPYTSIQDIEKSSEKAGAFFLGPGLPTDEESCALLKEILEKIKVPFVLDGGALYHLATKKIEIPIGAILTPHTGEMNRFLPINNPLTTEDVLHCQSFANEKQVTLIVKGAPTYIFHPNHPIYISQFGHPAMAKMGSGDVLTGVIAAFLAQNLKPLEAALLGVGIHGIAGECAAHDLGSYSVIASDLIDYLSEAFLFLEDLQNR